MSVNESVLLPSGASPRVSSRTGHSCNALKLGLLLNRSSVIHPVSRYSPRPSHSHTPVRNTLDGLEGTTRLVLVTPKVSAVPVKDYQIQDNGPVIHPVPLPHSLSLSPPLARKEWGAHGWNKGLWFGRLELGKARAEAG